MSCFTCTTLDSIRLNWNPVDADLPMMIRWGFYIGLIEKIGKEILHKIGLNCQV